MQALHGAFELDVTVITLAKAFTFTHSAVLDMTIKASSASKSALAHTHSYS